MAPSDFETTMEKTTCDEAFRKLPQIFRPRPVQNSISSRVSSRSQPPTTPTGWVPSSVRGTRWGSILEYTVCQHFVKDEDDVEELLKNEKSHEFVFVRPSVRS